MPRTGRPRVLGEAEMAEIRAALAAGDSAEALVRAWAGRVSASTIRRAARAIRGPVDDATRIALSNTCREAARQARLQQGGQGVRENEQEWRQDEIDTLARLWTEGLSSAHIGAALGRSKNSVIGKVGRLGLPRRPSPIKNAPARTAKPKPAPLRGAAVRAIAALPLPRAPREVEPRPAPVLPPMSAHARCCWPLWRDDQAPTHRYCEAPARQGWSYCDAHAAKARGEPGKASTWVPGLGKMDFKPRKVA